MWKCAWFAEICSNSCSLVLMRAILICWSTTLISTQHLIFLYSGKVYNLIPGSNDSAVDVGIYWLQLHFPKAVMEKWCLGRRCFHFFYGVWLLAAMTFIKVRSTDIEILFHWSLFKQSCDIIYSDFSLKGGLSKTTLILLLTMLHLAEVWFLCPG